MIQFAIYGQPATQGSKRPVPIYNRDGPVFRDGRILTRIIEDNPKLADWRSAVASAASEAYQGELLTGPLCVTMTFQRPRPANHFRTGKHAGELKPACRDLWPTSKPDLFKLARAVEDSLTGVIYRDDSQIIREVLEKCFGARFVVHVRIEEINGLPQVPDSAVMPLFAF